MSVDPTFPQLHIRPDRGWLNDPNGLARIDGTYHVFFQYNPSAPVHRDVAWGHASSTDLLRWTEEPVALSPRPGGIDGGGCWSGCLVDDAGTPTAVYTAVHDHAGNAGVALARSDRTLRSWQPESQTVIGTPTLPGVTDVRDPFVFSHDGHRYAVQGAGDRYGRPQVLLWECDDLTRWTFLGSLITSDDPVAAQVAAANIWECPNLAKIDGQWVLLLSLWRWRDEVHELAGVRYLVGDLMPQGPGLRFVARAGGVVDEGPSFYAPQLLAEPGRTLLWGWSWEVDRSEAEVMAAGWAGVLTFPRELFLHDGALGTRPAAELTGLRAERLPVERGVAFAAAAFEVVDHGTVELWLVEGEQSRLVSAGDGSVRILVDGSIVETFVDGSAHTTRAYPTAASRWMVATPGVPVVYRLATD